MKENAELKRYNIEPIRELNEEEIEYIATEVTKKMETMLPEFNGNHLYEQINNAKMYIARIPNKYTKVNYIVSNNTIYIRGEENIKNIDETMFHEIFHYIQCNQKNNPGGMPEQMGLCKFKAYKIKGLAINEAATQLVISIIFNNKQENNNFFGIQVKSIYNRYFPILCALLQQVIYVLGHKELLNSMLENNDDFQKKFEEFAGRKAYDFLLESFDKMMEARDKIAEKNRILKDKNLNKRKAKILQKQIDILVKEIQNHFFAIQKLCYTEYFNPLFKNVKNKDDILELKEEIQKYHQHTGKVNEKDDFMIYVQNKMHKLNKKIR